ncbi:MAG: hypothetical protein JWM31_515 [Solirubrobacterales bacterium]|nr:hypothetical protein [Solirubrobacterales bacterium]
MTTTKTTRPSPGDRGAAGMSATVVRYRLHPDRVQENAALVRAVYAELHALAPAGIRYETFTGADGLDVVHVARHDPQAPAVLTGLESFRAFRAHLADRCAQGPDPLTLPEQLGGYPG